MASRLEFQNAACSVDAETLQDAVEAARQGGDCGQNAGRRRDGMGPRSPARARSERSTTVSPPPGWDRAILPRYRETPWKRPLSQASGTRSGPSSTTPRKGYDAASITARVVALGGAVHPDFEAIAEACARRHPGAGCCAHASGAGPHRPRRPARLRRRQPGQNPVRHGHRPGLRPGSAGPRGDQAQRAAAVAQVPEYAHPADARRMAPGCGLRDHGLP